MLKKAGERGAITVLVPVVVGMLLVMAAALLDITAVLSARIRSQTAADAAALAAAPATFDPASSPRKAARRMAKANGARLVWCRCRVDRRPLTREVSVKTEMVARLWLWEDVRVFAVARAEFAPYSEEE